MKTSWRITAIDGQPRLTGLNVELTVDTTSLTVLNAIEAAAERNGITLELVEKKAVFFGDPPH